eukprot:366301-Chlamydomonas_euryale.AAC.27
MAYHGTAHHGTPWHGTAHHGMRSGDTWLASRFINSSRRTCRTFFRHTHAAGKLGMRRSHLCTHAHTSAWPCGASSCPNTSIGRTTRTPGASIGTSTMLCCLCAGAEVSVLPMKMATRQRGSHAPLVHHLTPFRP